MLWTRCFLGITYRCNLRCEHCYANDFKNGNDLSYDDACRLIDQLYSVGVLSICYSHSENMLHPDFWRITKYIYDHEIYIVLMTNGTAIQKVETANRLYEVGVRKVFVSLDSLNRERHENRRGVPNCYNRALNALRNLKKVDKLQVGISFVLDEYNWGEIDDVVKFSLNEGLQRINFLPIRPRNQASVFNMQEYRKVAQKLIDYELQLRDQICIQIHDPLIPLLVNLSDYDSKTQERINLENCCDAGRGSFSVAPDGSVRPCNFIQHVAGNVNETPLSRILGCLSPDVYENSTPLLCMNCKRVTICRGGCKAFARNFDENGFSIDRRCLDNQLKLS
jgi:radical SAM protein with 4Fe4S-binding SPASM domain